MNTKEDTFDKKKVIQFLGHLNASIHLNQELKKFLKDKNNGRIHLEKLPAYSPKLDPKEGVGNYLKSQRGHIEKSHSLKFSGIEKKYLSSVQSFSYQKAYSSSFNSS